MKDWIEANSSVKKLKYPYLNGISKNTGWFQRTSDGGHVGPHNVRLNMSEVEADYRESTTPLPIVYSETCLIYTSTSPRDSCETKITSSERKK